MNTPNKLTVLRVLLVPLFLAFLLVGRIPAHYLLALIVFIAASVTDSLDGYLARKNSQVTTFGKFLDPLADKILVLSAMISFIELGLCGSLGGGHHDRARVHGDVSSSGRSIRRRNRYCRRPCSAR